jgi:hypothetical protein
MLVRFVLNSYLGVKRRRKHALAYFFIFVVVLGIAALVVNSLLNPPVRYQSISLSQAFEKGLISSEIRGQGLDTISVNLTSNTNESYEIVIPAGSIFKPLSTNPYTHVEIQSMVLLRDEVFYVQAHSETQRFIDVACASMKLMTPGWADYFGVSNTQTESDIIKLLNTVNFKNETARVKQFAIWTITDNPSQEEYTHLITITIEPRPTYGINNPYQTGTGPSDQEMNSIKTLFEKAGIPTNKYNAFNQTVPTPSPSP